MLHRIVLCATAAIACNVAVVRAAPAPPTSVIVELVTKQRVTDSLEALGTLRANEAVEITAKVADTVSAVRFEDGKPVQAGDVLIELTNSEEEALLAEAVSLADEARRQFERIEQLVKQGSASQALLDERRQQWRTAQAREQAVRSRLQDRFITAPFSGHVGLRLVSPGALISPGDVVTTLVDDSRMKLDFTIPAVYLDTVRRGVEIKATSPAFPGETFRGEVSSIDATVDPSTRSLTVRAIVPNPEQKLVPGMLMTLNLQRNARDAIVVAEEAIIPRGDSTHVLVVDMQADPNVAEQRSVTLGRRFAGRVEVRSGLATGETVISHGTLKVRPGMPVKIKAVDDGSRSVAEMIRADSAASG